MLLASDFRISGHCFGMSSPVIASPGSVNSPSNQNILFIAFAKTGNNGWTAIAQKRN